MTTRPFAHGTGSGEAENTASVEVVIPHRSRWDLLSKCLHSLEAQTLTPAVCVVDNASDDESLRELSGRPNVRVCQLTENVGFGRAVNYGVATSTARYVVILNNDMIAEPTCIEQLVSTLNDAPPRTVTAATQLRMDGRIDTLGVAVDAALGVYDVGHGLLPEDTSSEPLTPLGPSGGAMGIRRELYVELGGYDETFFAYLEDVDLALRFALADVTYRPSKDAVVWHAHSATLGSGSRHKNQLMGWSRGYLLWKYRPSLSFRARLRGMVTDAIVYGGQVVIDRNGGALEGRMRFARERTQLRATPIRADLPHTEISLRNGLRRRRARR